MKPVKCDPELLRLARAALIEKLAPRLKPEIAEVDGVKTVTGFRDPEFVKTFGPGLEKLPDSQLVSQALLALVKQVSLAPAGLTGSQFLDHAEGPYADLLRRRRKEAVERIISSNIEVPPDPDALCRELDAAHAPGGLH